MAISIVFIGILVMLDVVFFVNFLAIKYIRAWTDQTEEQIEANHSLANKGAPEGPSTSCLPSICNRSSAPRSATVYSQAFFMDVVHREKNSVHKFEKWRELPYACGKWSTVALVLLSLSLLSFEFIVSMFEPLWTCCFVLASRSCYYIMLWIHFVHRLTTPLPKACRLLPEIFVEKQILVANSIVSSRK